MRVIGGRRTLLSFVSAGALFAGAALAQEAQPVDIPAQPLSTALAELGEETGLQVSADASLVADLESAAVSGLLTPTEALLVLLSGTGLSFRSLGPDGVVLEAARGTASAEDAVLLPEITVTARRTEERVQDVPGTVVVLTEEELERSVIEDTDDAIFRLPNVNFTGNASPIDLGVSVRGISNLSGLSASGPTTGIFADGFLLNPTGGTTAINPELLDLERVETAFGPQGTAFGRGAIGGAINFVTKKPSPEFEGSLTAEVGSFPDGRGRAIVNVPFTDALFSRFVAFGDISDGFIDLVTVDEPNAIGRSSTGVRGSLRALPTERLTLDASISFDHTDFDATNSATQASIAAGDPISEIDFVGENALDRLLVTGEAAYDFDVGLLTSKTSFLDTESFGINDTDNTLGAFSIGELLIEERAVAQELRFESEELFLPRALGRVSVNGGLSFSFNSLTLDPTFIAGDDTIILAASFLPPEILAFFLGIPVEDVADFDVSTIPDLVTPELVGTSRSPFDQDVFNLGVYGDVRWKPIPELELAVGARFNRDRVEAAGLTETTGLTALLIPSVPLFEGEEVFTDFSPNASIKYDWTEDFSTYFSFSTGYRPGGFSQTSTGVLTFDEETARSFEAGFRSSWFDDRLLITGSGFFLDYDDIQVLSVDPTAAVADVFIDNAASARSIGSEIGITARPAPGLSLDLQMGLTFAKFTDFATSPFGDLTGTQLPNAPVHTLSVTVDYEHPEPAFGSAHPFVRAEHTYRSSFQTVITPTAIELDGFNVVNFRLGLRADRFELSAFVENAFDAVYATGATSVATLGALGAPVDLDIGETRRFGLRGRIQF
ncbi:MAG: TonB-dependent receptor [Pseudomonadota bacterium]